MSNSTPSSGTGSISAGARKTVLVLTLALPAFAAESGIAGKAGADAGSAKRIVRLQRTPLGDLPQGVVLVAGERLSARWTQGDSLARLEVRYRGPGPDTAWRLLRRADPEIAAAARRDWPLPADIVGGLRLRIEDAGSNKVLGELAAEILPPAGSPGTGPFLDIPLEPAVAKSDSSPDLLPYRTARQMGNAQFRLASASGGRKCLPQYGTLRRFALEDRDGGRGTGLAILTSRVRYHYWDPDAKSVKPGEFRAVGLLQEKVPYNRVAFLLKDEYYFTDLADTVSRATVRIGTDTLRLGPGRRAEYLFPGKGRYTLEFRVETTSGASWGQVTTLDVEEEIDPDLLARQRLSEKRTGLPAASPLPGVAMREPHEIDSLSRTENQPR